MISSILLVLVLCGFIQSGTAVICGTVNGTGQIIEIVCPQLEQPREYVCCGYGPDAYHCCFDPEVVVHDLAMLLWVLAGIVLAVLLVCICVLCCCFCPFCLIAKRRNRARLTRGAAEVAIVMPTQNDVQLRQQPYPQQPSPQQDFP
ncbi:uncharacterized protein LOC108682287 [Hyalella azteca]|uniref:Uncharacterized protein LOC108682287 n=1 Tax=Hyalella azteca TaxID=294128 RepID=A0A979FR57_HYAAZ|nr:uncharacterized protein LOC108682287 [Hyalella azteca]